MRKSGLRYLIFAPPVIAAAFAFHGMSVSAQSGANPESALVAIASVERDHTHSIVLRPKDVAELIGRLDDGESVDIESSSGFDGGVDGGASHTHQVPMAKEDLQALVADGTVSVLSDVALGHRHEFTFVMQQNCPAVAAPLPLPLRTRTPRPSGSPSVSPSPSPSISPSPSPSVSPSPSPSPSPSMSPSPSPSGSPSGTPSPGSTPSAAPSAAPSTVPSPGTGTGTPGPILTGAPQPGPTLTFVPPSAS